MSQCRFDGLTALSFSDLLPGRSQLRVMSAKCYIGYALHATDCEHIFMVKLNNRDESNLEPISKLNKQSQAGNSKNLHLGRMVEVFSTSSTDTDLQSVWLGSVHLTSNPSLSAGVGVIWCWLFISVTSLSLIIPAEKHTEDYPIRTVMPQFLLKKK